MKKKIYQMSSDEALNESIKLELKKQLTKGKKCLQKSR